MATITTVFDHQRGCGFRKPGGLYLMSGTHFQECGKLPIALTVCKCCGQGIKPARGWNWISRELIADAPCRDPECDDGFQCVPFGDVDNPYDSLYDFGLIWIGEKFYKTPADFMRECDAQGISRRINFVPKKFDLGRTWVMLAHRKTIYEPGHPNADPEGFVPGIFSAFKPDRIEYVITGEETEEELDKLEARGLTLVKVEKAEEQLEADLDIEINGDS